MKNSMLSSFLVIKFTIENFINTVIFDGILIRSKITLNASHDIVNVC